MQKDIYQKDTQSTNGISTMSLKSATHLNMESTILVFKKKAEKISTALYMITSVFEASEPMKNEIRSLAIRLAKESSGLSSKGQSEHTSVLDRIANILSELITMIEISTSVGIISDMNGMILMREFNSLKQKIYEREDSLIIPEELFKDETSNALPVASDKRHESLSDTNQSALHKTPILPPKTYNPNPKNIFKKQSVSDKKEGDTISKSSRRANIIKIIKDKKEVTIKDIASHITEYGEKTIQRELQALVGEGVLKKVGEKRWSKYSLI